MSCFHSPVGYRAHLSDLKGRASSAKGFGGSRCARRDLNSHAFAARFGRAVSAVPPPAQNRSTPRGSNPHDSLLGRQMACRMALACTEDGAGIEPAEACAPCRVSSAVLDRRASRPLEQSSSTDSNRRRRFTIPVLYRLSYKSEVAIMLVVPYTLPTSRRRSKRRRTHTAIAPARRTIPCARGARALNMRSQGIEPCLVCV